MAKDTIETEDRICYSCRVRMGRSGMGHRAGCCALDESGIAPDAETAAKGRAAYLLVVTMALDVRSGPVSDYGY